MSTLLHLDCSPRGDRSVSRTLARGFICQWMAAHPGDHLLYRDLGRHGVPPITEAWYGGAFSSPADHTPEMAAAMAVSNQLVDQFLSADRYVFAMPMFNLHVPANFKAWVDQIVRVGRTLDMSFKPMVTGRKMLVITARGNVYTGDSPLAEYDFQEPWMRAIFFAMGIDDITFVHCEGTALGDEAKKQEQMTGAAGKLSALVDTW